MRWGLLLVALGSLSQAGTAARGDEPALVPIGAARVDITPEGPIRLSGYGDRKAESEGVIQKLWAKALAIGGDEGDGPAILITVDNLGIPASVTDEVIERLQRDRRIRSERIAVCATHTHTAPCLSGVAPNLFSAEIPEDQQERIDRYTRRLTGRLVQVAREALDARQPGRLAWGQGSVGFAMNRRVVKDGRWTGFGTSPDAPVQHALPVLEATSADGKTLAVLAGYACHCTTLTGAHNQVCGDWAGYAQEAIERDRPGAVGMIVIGCGGDANPEPRGELDMARVHGETLAKEALRVISSGLTPLPGTITARFKQIQLPFDTPPTREQFAELAKQPGATGFHARRQLERLDAGKEQPKHIDYPVQTWCFGDALALVFLGGEVVVDYDLRLRRELDGKKLWVIAYANDVPCYIASKRLMAEGGYEVDGSMLYYDRPTRLAPETEDLIIQAVHALLPKSFGSNAP